MTLATEKINWAKGHGGWHVAAHKLNGCELLLLKNGKNVAVTATSLASYFGLKRNRLILENYAERIGNRVTEVRIGHGFGNYKNGIIKAVYASNIRGVLVACNVKVDESLYKPLAALIQEASRSTPAKVDEAADAPAEPNWIQGDEAKALWLKTIDHLKKESVPTAAMLVANANGWAFSTAWGKAHVMVATTAMFLMTDERRELLDRALTRAVGVPMKATIFSGKRGVGPLSELKGPECHQPALPNMDPSLPVKTYPLSSFVDEVPFDGPVAGATQEEEDRAVMDASDRDLLNAMGSVLSGLDRRVEDLVDDLAGIERKIDRYTELVGRRNRVLSQILIGLADVLGANLCAPTEHDKGRWLGEKIDD